MNTTSGDILPKHTITIPRREVAFAWWDTWIYAIDTPATHTAYSRQNQLSKVNSVLVINGHPSVWSPMYTQQSLEELKPTQDAVAKLLWLDAEDLIPFTDMDYVLRAHESKRDYAIQCNQVRYTFAISDDSLNTIKEHTWLVEDDTMLLVENNPAFRDTALHYSEKIEGEAVKISLSR